MSCMGLGSPFNHSLRPGRLPRPNCFDKDGRRKSPSKSRIFGCCLLAKIVARFGDTVLLPSSGHVLVINSFFSGRVCWSCLRRTPRNRNFSAPKLSGALRHTNLLSGAGVTDNDWNWLRSFATRSFSLNSCSAKSSGASSWADTSFGAVPPATRSTARKSSVASSGGAVATPDRSDSDLCNASNIRLLFTGSSCCCCPRFALARLQLLQIVVEQQQWFFCPPRIAFFILRASGLNFGLMHYAQAEIRSDILYDVRGDAARLPGVPGD